MGFSLLLFFFLTLSISSILTDAHPELQSLLDLKTTLDPESCYLSSWTINGDPCDGSFEGVACNEIDHVVNIALQGKGLTGKLSPAIARFKHLTALYLHYNSLCGEIPREIADLYELSDLYLNVNNFSGEVLAEIGNMANLQGFYSIAAGMKRKAESLAIASGEGILSFDTSKKKKKQQQQQEWTCDLCNVRTTGELTLQIHLLGKKHKAKESAALTQVGDTKTATSEICPSPDKCEKINGQVLPTCSLNSNQGENSHASVGGQDGLLAEGEKQKNLQFWCQACKVATNSEAQMEAHKMGKKHMAAANKTETVVETSESSSPLPNKSEKPGGENSNGDRSGMCNGKAAEQEGDVMSSMDIKHHHHHQKFWCLMCNFGTNIEAQMQSHMMEKMHFTLLWKNGGAVIEISTLPDSGL